MVIRRTLAAAAPAAAAALLLLTPGAVLANGNGNRSGDTVELQAKADNGTEVATGPAGCQNDGGTCHVTTTGTANVRTGNYGFPATYTSTLAIDYGHVTYPRAGYYCAPATGTVHIQSQSNASDSIDKTEQGQVCGGTGVGAAHTFTGSYQVTGGSGRFSGATGSGSVRSADDGAGNVTSSHEWGTISYPGAK